MIITMTLAHVGAAHLLEEALRSAPFADAHFVLDTSPDKPAVAEAIAKMNGLEKKVIRQTWPWREDFSAARNELFARATLLSPGEEKWGVIVDSDERLDCADIETTRQEIATIASTGMVYDTSGFYAKDRAFKLPTTAKYTGPTHEACIDRGEVAQLQSFKFVELGKTPEQVHAKLRRDVTILRRHVKKYPCDARWWYFLGYTLESLGNKKEAIEVFAQCERLKGWDEEGAWACYRAANILLAMERYQEAVNIASRGLARHSGVAELAWVAAVASFRSGAIEKAAHWARMAVAVGDHKGPNDSHKRSGFRHLPALFELPYDILRFALPTQEEKAEAEREFWAAKYHRYGAPAEIVAVTRSLNYPVLTEARNDIGRWVKALPTLVKSVKIYPIENPGAGRHYHCMNPSVTTHQGQLVVAIRTVNYTINEVGRYVIPPEDEEIVKTENYLADVSADDFSLSNIRPIVDKTNQERFPTLVRGYEDLRLASVNGKLYASATVRDHGPACPCDVTVCEINTEGEIISDQLQPKITAGRDEKNWMPLVSRKGKKESLSFLYSIEPTIVRAFDPATGSTTETHRNAPKYALDHLRGGPQVIAIPKQGWLAVTHEVVVLDDRRRYLHRFLRLDNEFKLTHLSHAWQLRDHLGIEFVAGMVVHAKKLILSVGLEDREACFVVLDLEDALRLASEIQE